MQERMKNPAMVLPQTLEPIKALMTATYRGGVPPKTLALVHMRASQINGCSSCVGTGAKHAERSGESVERLLAVAAWRDSPLFTGAERAALALAESVTRLADSSDPVPDDVWTDTEQHFDEAGRASLLLMIAITNFFNRLNVATRQVAGKEAWAA